MLLVEDLNGLLLSDVVQTDDTIGDALGLDHSNPTDLSGVIAVSTAAGFGVDTLDVDDSQGVAGDDTTLVEMETVLLLSVSLVHEVFVDGVAVVDDSVGLIFNGALIFLRDTLEMSDVQMGTLDGLLGTILPDVGSKDLSAGGKDDMGASVMSTELASAFHIDVY